MSICYYVLDSSVSIMDLLLMCCYFAEETSLLLRKDGLLSKVKVTIS